MTVLDTKLAEAESQAAKGVGLSGKQASARRTGMAERAAQQLAAYFPDVPLTDLWSRKRNNGFSTIPRTLPIIMEIIDSLSRKGQPAGHAYFSLWCRAPDSPLVVVENPLIVASEAGFSGERAVDTWRRRMRCLREVGFIKTKEGAAGEFHYILLLNPNVVAERLQKENRINDGLYRKLYDRILEIGAKSDLDHAKVAQQAG
ncbi:hypothetical protein [Geopseudomonas aromaticivorans]